MRYVVKKPNPKSQRWMQYVRRRGFEAERELVRGLRRLGVLAWRIPASGMYESRRKMSLPDVIAFCKGEFLGFQVKSTAKDSFVVYRRFLEPLDAWLSDVLSHGVPARAFIAVKFTGNFWVVRKTDCSEEKTVIRVGEATRLRSQLLVALGLQARLG